MSRYLLSAVCALALAYALGLIVIPLLKKLHAGQTVLKYVESHKGKDGTPTMGGLFFIVSASVVFVIFGGLTSKIATVALLIGLAFLAVGFIDDFIKVKFKQNEGLKAYQKIIFQLAIAGFAGVFCYFNGITVFYLPFVKNSVDFGIITIPFVALIFIAITNSVNLTDGLDGLAGSVSLVYLMGMVALIFTEISLFNHLYVKTEEYWALILLAFCLMGAITGFLVFNVNKAKVFMGDTGSLSLGGFLGAISIFSSNSLFIIFIGIMFVCSSVSVIIQVLHFKRTKKRVFLMAPLHHHFQMKGYSEAQISFCYSVITGIMGVIAVIFYL